MRKCVCVCVHGVWVFFFLCVLLLLRSRFVHPRVYTVGYSMVRSVTLK